MHADGVGQESLGGLWEQPAQVLAQRLERHRSALEEGAADGDHAGDVGELAGCLVMAAAPAASTGCSKGRQARKSARVIRCRVPRIIVARSSRRSPIAVARSVRANGVRRDHSPMNGGFGTWACMPASVVTASSTPNGTRASSSWRARVARFSSPRVIVGRAVTASPIALALPQRRRQLVERAREAVAVVAVGIFELGEQGVDALASGPLLTRG